MIACWQVYYRRKGERHTAWRLTALGITKQEAIEHANKYLPPFRVDWKYMRWAVDHWVEWEED